jgi:hypothetical protein
MPDFDHFIYKLESNEELSVSKITSARKKKFKLSFFLLIFTNTLVLVVCSYLTKLNHYFLYIGLVYTLLNGYFYYKLRSLYHLYSSVYLKGDSMIIKNVRKQFCVTSIRSITKVTSKRFRKKMYTYIHYNIDNTDRRALLINKKERYGKSTPDLLNTALNYFKNKKTNL